MANPQKQNCGQLNPLEGQSLDFSVQRLIFYQKLKFSPKPWFGGQRPYWSKMQNEPTLRLVCAYPMVRGDICVARASRGGQTRVIMFWNCRHSTKTHCCSPSSRYVDLRPQNSISSQIYCIFPMVPRMTCGSMQMPQKCSDTPSMSIQNDPETLEILKIWSKFPTQKFLH